MCIPNVSLPDQDTSVVDTLCEAQLIHTCLQSSLQEILDFEGKHVIKLHSGLVEHTHSNETSNQSVTLEEAFGIFLFHGQELTVAGEF